MKKHQLRLKIAGTRALRGRLLHLTLVPTEGSLPPMMPGQFVEVAVDKAKVLLNRPFSIFYADSERLELIVKALGRASEVLFEYAEGDELTVIAPLGSGFATDVEAGKRVLLVGGGVGIAPLYYQAIALNRNGITPIIIYGDRTAPDQWLLETMAQVGTLQVCTDDGSAGFHGLVTAHPAYAGQYDLVQVCGPMPMMKAIYADRSHDGARIQFSLENKMACGLGACLCCVEKTTTGNRCVCTDGPVFDKTELKW